MENNKELFAKAKAAETPEALLTLAKENGMEMTDESAAAYFEIMHPTLRSACDEIFRRYFQVRSMRKAAELQ